MRKFLSLAKTILAALLCAASIQGCAQMNAYAQHDDCRTCHVANLAPGAKDFSAIYADTASHHPVNMKYPAGDKSVHPEFNQPDKRHNNISFFDSNGNGQADSDEVQLFEKTGVATIVCASCHRPHGRSPDPAGMPINSYLRVDNVSSALCIICHNK